MKITHLTGITLFAVFLTANAWGQSSFRLAATTPADAPAAQAAPAEAATAPAAAEAADVAPAPAAPAPATESTPAAPAPVEAAKPENGIASPSDAPPAPVAAAPEIKVNDLSDKPAQAAELSLSDKDACETDGCGGLFSCNPSEPWKLPQPCFLQKHKTVLGGWLQQGITFNDQNSDGFNGPVATNDMAGEYQMNQMWVYLHRPADTGGCGFAWGGHVDMIYGTDWRFGINHGLEDRINGFDYQSYGLVIPQAYLELAYNDLSVKLGHFAAILDYEGVPAIVNPFYSHSYSYGYTVPLLVTGALADWKMTDQFSVQAGFHRGREMFEDFNDELAVMAGVKWVSSDKKTSVAYALSSGQETVNYPPFYFNDENRFVYSLVIQRELTEKLKYVLVHNLGFEKEPFDLPMDAEWYGLNNYLLYKINACWSANLRAEWLRDDDGMRIAGPGNIPGIRAWDGAGYAGNFFEVTAGLNWRPTGNWLIRPEVRWDWYDGADSFVPGKPLLPFGNGESDKQTTFAVDAVLTF